MRSTGVNSVAQDRTRPPVDESRPGTGPLQPEPQRPATARSAGGDDRSRSELLRRLREQISGGVYEPPLDAVAERLAAFFVVDRRYLPREPERRPDGRTR